MPDHPQLNLSPLISANSRLGEFLALYQSVADADLYHDALRAAVVKAYEFTYGLAYGTIRHYLASEVLPPGDVAQMNNYDIIRAAARSGLLPDPEVWFDFRDRRNETSHEYFEEIADRVATSAADLHQAVSELIAGLRERINDAGSPS